MRFSGLLALVLALTSSSFAVASVNPSPTAKTASYSDPGGLEIVDYSGLKLIHVAESTHSLEAEGQKARVLNAVKPDAVFFEIPVDAFALERLNAYHPLSKPLDEVRSWKSACLSSSGRYPWMKGEIQVVDTIVQIWGEGKQVLLFGIDAPQELLSTSENRPGLGNITWNYLRERWMVSSLINGLRSHNTGSFLILCHDYHWNNLKFLLRKPSASAIWDRYYSKTLGFKVTPEVAEKRLADGFPTLWKFWKTIRERESRNLQPDTV